MRLGFVGTLTCRPQASSHGDGVAGSICSGDPTGRGSFGGTAADAFASGPAHRRSAGFGAPASPAVFGQLGLCSGRRRRRRGQDGLSGEPRRRATTRALTRGSVSFRTFPPTCWARSRGCAGSRGQGDGDGAVSRQGSGQPTGTCVRPRLSRLCWSFRRVQPSA